MADRIAIKRLTASDCTLFEAVFRTINAGNQKSINLNADVLVGRLYPNLSVSAAATDNQIALAISIFGPDAKQAHKVSRKIIKNPSYKNWRLNGEFITGPTDDPSRYDNIRPGDLAVMAFHGVSAPSGMDLILISQSAPADTALLAALGPLFGNRSMIEASATQIGGILVMAGISESHPVRIAAADPEIEAALEDVVHGGSRGIEWLLRNRGSRPVSGADLATAKAKAEQVGRDGEGLVNIWLAHQVSVGALAEYSWVSATNAVAPFDFEMLSAGGERTLIDAKSTSGPFENVLHLSLAEVIAAAGKIPYRLYRVFYLTDDGGMLRISDDIRPLATALKAIHETHMPAGVRVDGFSVSTGALSWGDEEKIVRPEEEGPSC